MEYKVKLNKFESVIATGLFLTAGAALVAIVCVLRVLLWPFKKLRRITVPSGDLLP